jgi:hypothetical protein
MYQWYETVDETPVPAALRTGDHDSHSETTYSYDRGWFDYRIDSMTFRHAMGHHNPEFWLHNSSVCSVPPVSVLTCFHGTQYDWPIRDNQHLK